MFQAALLGRMDRNEKVVFKYLDDENLAADVAKVYATLAQARAKAAYQQHCPIGELLDAGAENAHLEFKSTLRTGAETGEVIKVLETASIKTVAAFANRRDGGTLLIGVRRRRLHSWLGQRTIPLSASREGPTATAFCCT